jgi:hypothetical protein
MSERTIPIAPVRLARSAGRLLAPTALLLATAGVTAAGAVALGGLAGIGLLIAAGVVGVLSLYLLIILLTVRLDVEVAAIHLRWAGGDRSYALTRGPVTRVAVRGPGSAAIRPRFGALGWGLGPARLRGQERIELVRMAPTATVILVPTDRGRLAVAPASEAELVAALTAAARVQQRLDDVASHARTLMPLPRPAPAPEAAPSREPAALLRAAAAGLPEGRLLTGIERQLLEERLAAERAEALVAAEAERAAAAAAVVADTTATRGEAPAAAPAPAIPSIRRARRPLQWQRPGWVRRPGWAQRPSLRPADGVGLALAGAPLVAAGMALAAAAVAGMIDGTPAELRPVWLALILVGPAGTLGALMARAWFPRQLGLVVVTAVLACLLIGRAALS